MARPLPATSAARDQILAVLRDAGGVPMSTNEIGERIAMMPWTAYRYLAPMRNLGLIGSDVLGGRAYWRLAMR